MWKMWHSGLARHGPGLACGPPQLRLWWQLPLSNGENVGHRRLEAAQVDSCLCTCHGMGINTVLHHLGCRNTQTAAAQAVHACNCMFSYEGHMRLCTAAPWMLQTTAWFNRVAHGSDMDCYIAGIVATTALLCVCSRCMNLLWFHALLLALCDALHVKSCRNFNHAVHVVQA
jgi:hypothetical protein